MENQTNPSLNGETLSYGPVIVQNKLQLIQHQP